ncbi:MAG: WbuC family cupin fold metalloprotein [Rikenellaceae bacterium]
MKSTILIDDKLLDEITLQAKAQKMINSLEPDTVIPIHRHRSFSETYIVLRGTIKVFLYDANKTLTNSYLLDPCDGTYGIEIPAGVFHNLEVIAHGTAIFEVKDGPFIPVETEDIL